MNRTEILTTAQHAVTVDRAATHGEAEDNFALIAAYWSLHLGQPVTARDIGPMMALFKLARVKSNPAHADNYVDGAGYLAIAGELATENKLPNEGITFDQHLAARYAGFGFHPAKENV